MLSNSTYALLSVLVACSPLGDGDAQAGDAAGSYSEAISEISSGGCTIVQGLTNGGAPPYLISPRSAIVSEFTRPLFPHFFKQGSWSTGQFVRDSNGLTLPAVTAGAGGIPGWMSLPFNSGETVIGVSLTVCGDGTTFINADTFATQFAIESKTNAQDLLSGTGSDAQIRIGPTWQTIDIGMEPLLLSDISTFWLDVVALQTSSVVPTPPPSMAISQIVLHINH